MKQIEDYDEKDIILVEQQTVSNLIKAVSENRIDEHKATADELKSLGGYLFVLGGGDEKGPLVYFENGVPHSHPYGQSLSDYAKRFSTTDHGRKNIVAIFLLACVVQFRDWKNGSRRTTAIILPFLRKDL